ncbi:unnamed protein product, partial [Mesorhabditis spiculigera]
MEFSDVTIVIGAVLVNRMMLPACVVGSDILPADCCWLSTHTNNARDFCYMPPSRTLAATNRIFTRPGTSP